MRPLPDNAIRVAPLVVTFLMATGAGCGTAARNGTGGTGGGGGQAGPTGSGGAASSVDAGTACHHPLGAQPQDTCPPTDWDDSWQDPVCRLSPFTLKDRSCGTYHARTVGFVTEGYTCYYENARHTLIGVSVSTDTPSFCDNTSFTMVFGEIPPQDSCTAAVDLHDICAADGGALDGARADAEPNDTSVTDTAPQDTGSTSDARPVCRGGQADAQTAFGPGCPLSFPGTTCLHSGVTPIAAIVYEQQCQGYRRRNYGFGTLAVHCYYDPTALTLVAAEYFDDVPRFCGGSYGITYGDIPPSGTCEPVIKVDQPCPSDAAAPDSSPGN